MRIFVFEHVTGGGMAGEPLPPSLVLEADMMVRSLVADLLEIPGISVHCSRDPRLAPIPVVDSLVPRSGEPVQSLFARGMAAADAVWPTAPETGGALEQLAAEILRGRRILLGCTPAAVRIAGSKRATALALTGAGIDVVPTLGPGDPMIPLPGPWVVKPDDGAGSQGVRRVAGWREAVEALAHSPHGWVTQPWLSGNACSLALLCSEEHAMLLSVNRQLVRVEGDQVQLDGVTVNAIADTDGRLAALGQAVARAIPGLWGYVGIDFVLTEAGPVVLEINPRLTTSYCGLRQALGVNVAAMVLGQLEGGSRASLPARRQTGTHQLKFTVPVDD